MKKVERRGRPKGIPSKPKSKTVKLDVHETHKILAEVADTTHPEWDWDGKTYPKTKRSHGPNMQELNKHWEVLLLLIRLAPNGYPDAYKLKAVFMQLHGSHNILPPDDSREGRLSIDGRATMAADRWRVMCKHCLMVITSKQEVPRCLTGLHRVLAAIRREDSTGSVHTAATNSHVNSLQICAGTQGLNCSMALTGTQSDESPVSM